jgi:hypothetical protein
MAHIAARERHLFPAFRVARLTTTWVIKAQGGGVRRELFWMAGY